MKKQHLWIKVSLYIIAYDIFCWYIKYHSDIPLSKLGIFYLINCGETWIRTKVAVTPTSLAVKHNKPLCHFSVLFSFTKVYIIFYISYCFIIYFFLTTTISKQILLIQISYILEYMITIKQVIGTHCIYATLSASRV